MGEGGSPDLKGPHEASVYIRQVAIFRRGSSPLKLGEGPRGYRGRRAGAWGKNDKQHRKQPFPICPTNLYLVTLQVLMITVVHSMFGLNGELLLCYHPLPN